MQNLVSLALLESVPSRKGKRPGAAWQEDGDLRAMGGTVTGGLTKGRPLPQQERQKGRGRGGGGVGSPRLPPCPARPPSLTQRMRLSHSNWLVALASMVAAAEAIFLSAATAAPPPRSLCGASSASLKPRTTPGYVSPTFRVTKALIYLSGPVGGNNFFVWRGS